MRAKRAEEAHSILAFPFHRFCKDWFLYIITSVRKKANLYDQATQIFLPVFTILGFLFISLNKPEIGLIFNLIAQIFWLYASYKAWKEAGQIGIFITTVILGAVILYGVINYWFII